MPSSTARGAIAGAAAAGAWLIAQPAIRVVTRSNFDDARLLGRLIRPNGSWRLAGSTAHVMNGALFGVAYTKFAPRHSPLAGIVTAQVENVVLWPSFFVVDRIHPDRRNGHWPPLATTGSVIAHELLGHLVFGAVLGVMEQKLNSATRASGT